MDLLEVSPMSGDGSDMSNKHIFAAVKRMEDKICEIKTKLLNIEGKEKAKEHEISKGKVASTTDYIKSHINEFCNVRLPFMQNLVGSKEPRMHRIASIIFNIVAVLISSFYILDAYTNWQTSPVVQSVVMKKAKEIPFPAITVCNPVTLREDYNRSEVLLRCLGSVIHGTNWRCSEEELNMFLVSIDIKHLENEAMYRKEHKIKRGLEGFYNNTFEYLTRIVPEYLNRTISGSEYLKYIDKVSNGCLDVKVYNSDMNGGVSRTINICDNTISSPFFLGTMPVLKGTHMFKCLTLNGVTNGGRLESFADESRVRSYRNFSSCDPDNVLKSNCKDDLLFTDKHLDIELIETHVPRRNRILSYSIFLHSPFDFPSFNTFGPLPPRRFSQGMWSLQPLLTNSMTELTTIDKTKRDCLFSFEKRLTMFQYYTHNNCIKECQINCALELCGCVPFSVAIPNSTVKICSNRKIYICNKVSDFFLFGIYKDERCGCDCPLDCISLSFDWKKGHIAPMGSIDGSKILLVYEQSDYPIFLRYSVNSPTEFVAYSLGILGMFNGFMMLLLEILYSLTFSLWSSMKMINSRLLVSTSMFPASSNIEAVMTG